MNILKCIQLLSLLYIISGSYRSKYPNCKHCKYYRSSLNNDQFSKCTKFFNEIKRHNIIIYEYAHLMRLDENKCGREAKYYENKGFKDMLDIIMDQN